MVFEMKKIDGVGSVGWLRQIGEGCMNEGKWRLIFGSGGRRKHGGDGECGWLTVYGF